MRKLKPLIALAALALVSSSAAFAYTYPECSDPYIAAFNAMPRPNVTVDFNDYGLALQAARMDEIQCNVQAISILYTKYQLTKPEDWKSFLSGAPLALLLATALELGGRGFLPEYVDAVARDAIRDFELRTIAEEPCGLAGGRWVRANSCMDDYAIAASGYGWATAYLRLTGREWQTARAKTLESIKLALDTEHSICIHDPVRYMRGESPCNSTVDQLGQRHARIISLNHGNQTPAYGIGLMPSIAAAFVALEVAEAPIVPLVELTPDERKIIEYLWIEGQEHTDAFGNFHSDSCMNMNPKTRSLEGPWGCHDQQFVSGDPSDGGYGVWPMDAHGVTGYQARWYRLNLFYMRYGFRRGSPHLYQFHEGVDTFDRDVWRFFGPGRRETFLTLGGAWTDPENRPPLSGNGIYHFAFGSPSPEATFLGFTDDPGQPLQARATVISGREVFTIYDLSGWGLESGDPVLIRIPDGRYVRALDDGSIEGYRLSGTTPEFLFYRIEKIGGEGRLIGPGDRIALRTPSGRYLTVGTDGVASATGSSAGEGEAFRLYRLELMESRH